MKRIIFNLWLISLICVNLLFSQDVKPQGNSFSFDNFYFEIDPNVGGRVSSFKLNDKELLYQTKTSNTTWGSVIWPSPQSEWNWPPLKAIDSQPYKVETTDNQIIMTSGKEPKTSLVVKKTYYASKTEQSVTMLYTFINEGTEPTKKSIWEVTRVPASGISFFPKGEGKITNDLAVYVEVKNNFAWYTIDESQIGNRKFFADGKEGWYAHVSKDNLLFIKQFEDLPVSKQIESEIQIYLTDNHSYIELENQGEYVEIEPGKSVDYLVKWYLRELPATINAVAGNEELVNYVRKVLGISTSATNAEAQTVDYKLFPNPASNYVKFTGIKEGNFSVKFYDISGKMVQENNNVSHNNAISIINLKNGIYLYKLDYQGVTYSKNFEVLK